jgi:hypothetical protein
MIAVLIKASIFVGLASIVATSVHAQEGGTIVVEGERDKSNRKICKSSAPMTGTRLGSRRICRTAAEWKTDEQRSQQTIELQQQRQRTVDAYQQNAKDALASPGPQ